MSDQFETPADIPYCLEPGKWVSGSTLIEKILADIDLRRSLASVCESPIEVDLAAVLTPLVMDRGYVLRSQFKLEKFRYDFAIETTAGTPLLLIECDGKEFHSTPEQKANDLAKNRAAARAGIRLERVTGSTIFRDPKRTADNIVQILGGR